MVIVRRHVEGVNILAKKRDIGKRENCNPWRVLRCLKTWWSLISKRLRSRCDFWLNVTVTASVLTRTCSHGRHRTWVNQTFCHMFASRFEKSTSKIWEFTRLKRGAKNRQFPGVFTTTHKRKYLRTKARYKWKRRKDLNRESPLHSPKIWWTLSHKGLKLTACVASGEWRAMRPSNCNCCLVYYFF